MRKVLLLTLFFLLTAGLAASVQAAPLAGGCNPFNPDGSVKDASECLCSQDPAEISYCMNATEYLKESLTQNAGIALLGGAQRVSELAWFLDRWAVALADFALDGSVWEQIRDAALTTLRSVVGGSGGVLDVVSRGQNGLMYLGLVLAGILLIVPVAVSGQQPVKLERVVLWGLFMSYLFVRTTQGFDLIGEAEALRVGMMQTILGGGSRSRWPTWWRSPWGPRAPRSPKSPTKTPWCCPRPSRASTSRRSATTSAGVSGCWWLRPSTT